MDQAAPTDATDAAFWTRAMALVDEFDRLPRSGPTAYGFSIGLYPIPGYPVLPDRQT